IFTAGIGENDAKWRAAVCEGLEIFGIEIERAKNEQNSHEDRDISKDGSKIKILVIPTDEELAIAQKTKETIEK
ncbi:MAG: acetate kinase, partial [Campylobacter sp.]|nr:acetate kinase [Campylobacter sp.]